MGRVIESRQGGIVSVVAFKKKYIIHQSSTDPKRLLFDARDSCFNTYILQLKVIKRNGSI
jgi:hypothetical protein